jgi:hypothetical protein
MKSLRLGYHDFPSAGANQPASVRTAAAWLTLCDTETSMLCCNRAEHDHARQVSTAAAASIELNTPRTKKRSSTRGWACASRRSLSSLQTECPAPKPTSVSLAVCWTSEKRHRTSSLQMPSRIGTFVLTALAFCSSRGTCGEEQKSKHQSD